MFCEKCAVLTRRLVYDPVATSGVEFLSGALIWSDERSLEWCWDCVQRARHWFRLRYEIVVGDPVSNATMEAWRQLQREYPNWPLFRLERCSSQNPEKVRRMVYRATRKFCVNMERLDREYREKQKNVEPKPN
jgi:hypothetical protein